MVVTILLVFLLGLVLFLVGLRQKRKLQASLSWPPASGIVTRTYIETTETGDSENGYSTSYCPHVEYRYDAAGYSYAGQRIGLSQQTYPTSKRAQAELAPYTVNTPVIVYFNPQKPSEAVLVKKAPGSGFLFWAGVVMMVVALAAAIGK